MRPPSGAPPRLRGCEIARIRAVKPEFWASEQVMELTPLARLAFIGMWNFCDDGGVHPASAKTLKAEVFPSDDLTAEAVGSLVGELIAQGLVIEFEADGKRYWHVTGWARHQRIEKPTYRHPQPDKAPGIPGALADPSPNPPGALADPSTPEGKGMEGKGSRPTSDEVGSAQASPDHGKPVPAIPDCPHQQIIALYAKHLPALPQPRIWEGQRAENLRARWRWVLTARRGNGQRYATDLPSALDFFDRFFSYATDLPSALDFFDRFFSYAADSDFLTGRNGSWQGCDLAWLVKAENFAKVLEGKYENRQEAAA